ncbi:hypothetical protein SDC9_119830 [bioreactor metagenome]|uniref:Uncharacterized protein n=1 Tax=bioreactor metagenome TaxID=1076179 RepID=A0A645C9J9_9ZZZZ
MQPADGQVGGDGAPVVGVALLDAEHQQEGADRAEGDAQPVEPVRMHGQDRHQPDGGEEAEDTDRHIDEEDPLPAETVGEQAAEQRADQHRDPGRRTPQGHRLGAFLRREEPGDHGHRLWGHQGGAEALDDPPGDQRAGGAGQAAGQRGDGEDGQADQVEVLGAVAVAEPAGDQQWHGVRQQVGAGDPDGRVQCGVEAGDDVRHRHRHDRGVDQDHEEPHHQRDQGAPGVPGGDAVVLDLQSGGAGAEGAGAGGVGAGGIGGGGSGVGAGGIGADRCGLLVTGGAHGCSSGSEGVDAAVAYAGTGVSGAGAPGAGLSGGAGAGVSGGPYPDGSGGPYRDGS